MWELERSGTADVSLLETTHNNVDTESWLFELDQSGSHNPVLPLNEDSFCKSFPTVLGDFFNPRTDGACSDPVQLGNNVFKIFDLEFNKVCICNDGYVVLDCKNASAISITPSDFYNLTEYIIAPALIQYKFGSTNRQKRDVDDSEVIYRRMSDSDLFAVKFKLQDPDFDATFGYIATWHHLGDRPNDNVTTNTFQVNTIVRALEKSLHCVDTAVVVFSQKNNTSH